MLLNDKYLFYKSYKVNHKMVMLTEQCSTPNFIVLKNKIGWL